MSYEELVEKIIALIGGGPGCGTSCDACRRRTEDIIELVREYEFE